MLKTMSNVVIRSAEETDLASIAALAARQQASPTHHFSYLGTARSDIHHELAEIEAWTRHTAVQTHGDLSLIPISEPTRQQ